MSEQVICSKCKDSFTKTFPKGKQCYYKTCEKCRSKKGVVTKKKTVTKKQNTSNLDWKSIVFGKPTQPKDDDENSSIIDSVNSNKHNISLASDSDFESEVKSQSSNLSRDTGLDVITYVADTVDEPLVINESPIVTHADDDDKPINVDDLQKEIIAKHENTVYVPVDTNSNDKQPTITEKLNTIIKLIESTEKKLSDKADGYNTSTKFLLEKMNSNSIKSSMIRQCDNDNEFSAYEIKLDKIVCRVSELENNLKFLISNVMDAHKSSSDKLKQAFEELSSRI